jgi:hypothetical protein
MNIRRRLGNFFLAVGIVLLALFFVSDYLEAAEGWYLFLGAGFFGYGIYLAVKGRKPSEPSQRFRTMRRMFGNSKNGDKKEKGENKEFD